MIENIFPTPIYYSIVDNLQTVQEELSNCIESIEFGINSRWGKTHYLSDPTFKTNFIQKYNLNNFKFKYFYLNLTTKELRKSKF